MSEVIDAMNVLSDRAGELDRLSQDLAKVRRELDPLKRECDDFCRDYLTGLWEKHVDEGAKMPRKDVAEALALKALPVEKRGRLERLTDSSERLRKRISDVKEEVDAQRSVLSALKVEMEATR